MENTNEMLPNKLLRGYFRIIEWINSEAASESTPFLVSITHKKIK